jgi:glycosyltransferase involved in cell wall biosynthesis
LTTVHFVVPAGIDDPRRPSGGNTYDRRVSDGLAGLGWQVIEHHVSGSWPSPDAAAIAGLASAISAVPDDAIVLVDGLVASAAAEVLTPAAERLQLIVLVHMLFELPGERAVLSVADAIVCTSTVAREQLLRSYSLAPDAVQVAIPGADPVDRAHGTREGGELLCVAPVSAHKGHDLLLSAMLEVTDLPWRCRVVGSLERDPAFAKDIRERIATHNHSPRVRFCGALTGPELSSAYASSDLLVHPSRGETYGMVISEALAHGLPVLATNVGGVPEAVGETSIGVPGLLFDADDPAALATELRSWLTDADLRSRLRAAAAERRQTLPSWQSTTERIAQTLEALLVAEPA